MFDFEETKRLTNEAFNDPQPGDRFHEMYSFWVYVVAVDGGLVTTCEMAGGWRRNQKTTTQTKAEFIKRFAYKSIPGYWVMLCDRGNDVSWYKPDDSILKARYHTKWAWRFYALSGFNTLTIIYAAWNGIAIGVIFAAISFTQAYLMALSHERKAGTF